MTAPLTRAVIEAAYLDVCRLEVRSLKPGNVHVYADGHGMQVRDFEISADVSAPVIADPKLKAGARVHRAVDATFKAVGCNTNLGILLLCAPLAVAAGTTTPAGDTLQVRLASVLATLDSDDAREAYAAIARANPGGLGDAAKHDVRQAPDPGLTLRQAMQAAADRDLIAQQYVTDFSLVFQTAAAIADTSTRRPREEAVTEAFLDMLQRIPDTHIARKYGPARADAVCRRAAEFCQTYERALAQSPYPPDALTSLLRFDKELKDDGLNPGSLADIIAAAIFAATLHREWPDNR